MKPIVVEFGGKRLNKMGDSLFKSFLIPKQICGRVGKHFKIIPFTYQ
ncbi:uncharacterized protein METZ01_LOCUS167235 [marine metagenome]|uniref:Uncharacterized protein n=1 Tax=marine metagenome TaxID=408172 RepID=A0A382BLH0_9ZZZZ